MTTFFIDLFQYPFLQYALAASLLSALASGVVGSLIVVRRSTYIAGAISHCVLGGLGVARFFQVVFAIHWFTPMLGALIAALIAACIITWATVYARERVDSVLSIIWALGMAIGITFIMKTPGYSQDLMSYLFGSILMVSPADLLLMLVLDGVIVTSAILFYNRILAVCFHEESALVRGIPVAGFTFLLLILSALTIVLLTQVVGVVLVIALLSIPAATVSRFTNRLSSMMIAATVASLFFTLAGLVVSYEPGLPVGATIIEIAAACYCIVVVSASITKKGKKKVKELNR
ncbi:MAG: metal ABC transporter permease [Chitinivibrionales bacterium]|nr:metal ABC transporter permease [Chitinivibrionales bacterium]